MPNIADNAAQTGWCARICIAEAQITTRHKKAQTHSALYFFLGERTGKAKDMKVVYLTCATANTCTIAYFPGPLNTTNAPVLNLCLNLECLFCVFAVR